MLIYDEKEVFVLKSNQVRILLSALLVAVLAFSAAFPAFAEQTTSGIQYTTDSAKKTAQITGYTGISANLSIPSKIDGYTVTSLKSEAFKGHNTIVALSIPDTVTSIGSECFSGCTLLYTLELGNDISSIGKGAFKNCIALRSIALPSGLSKLEDELFSGCKNLSSFSRYPSTIKTIGERTFYGCVSLPSKLTIPTSTTTVGNEAFAGCTSLESVSIGKGLTAVNGAAFSGCTGIKEFNVEDGASFSTNKGVLFNKEGTRLIAYPAGSSAEEYTVGDKVTSIGANAFDSCKNLKKLHIPATVKTIVEPAVKNCKNLAIYVERKSPAQTYLLAHEAEYSALKYSDALPGDVNNDGEVDNADVILLRRYVAKWKNINIQTDAADVNKDSEIDNADVILLRRYVAGWKNVTLK